MSVSERLSVVAVNFNGADVLPRMIDSVWASEQPPLELVVVDNLSTDSSRRMLAARDDVVLVAPDENTGFGGGCMAGARAARGELLLFLNPDVELRPDAIGHLVENLDANPAVAISFPKMVEPGQPPEPEVKLEDVSAAAGAVMLMRREDLDALGGFDPRIFLYFEEADLCWRARLAGRRVVQDWQAWAVHESHGSGGGPRWAAEQVKNGLLVYAKTRPWPVVARFAFWMAFKSVARGLQYRDVRLAEAWWVNLRRVPEILADRRRVRGAATPLARAELEALCKLGDFWRAYARRQRVRGALAAAAGRR